jgi:hypothetical protein
LLTDPSNSIPIDENTDMKEAVFQTSASIRKKLRKTEEELRFSNQLLKQVETWINKMSDLTTDDVPIDEALLMMMDQIEHKPNPLETSTS